MPDRVVFDSGSAERIARVVRQVESGNRDTSYAPPPPRMSSRGGDKIFRMASFTGAWSINSFKTVTVINSSQTLNVNNILFPVPELSDSTSSPTYCAVAKDRSTWHLVNIQFSDHAVLSDVTLQPTSLEFARRAVLAPGRTVSTTGITITECDDEAASAEQLNFFLR